LQRFSIIAAPLYELTKKNVMFKWSEQAEKAFNELKEKLTSAPVLMIPDTSQNFIVTTDASGVGMGAVLSQLDKKGDEVSELVLVPSASPKALFLLAGLSK